MDDIMQRYIKQWHIEQPAMMDDTASSILLSGRYDGQEIILKCVKPDSDEARSSAILNLYQGQGAVNLLAASDEALLLERIMPGTTLADHGAEEEGIIHIYCELITKLHQHDAISAALPSIEVMAQDYTHYLHSEDTTLDNALVEKAQKIFHELMASQQKQVALHGDLHHFNILYDHQHRGWLAIDPKGYIGEAECEIAPFLRNPLGQAERYATSSIMERRVTMIADQLHLDAKRIIHWCFALTSLGVIHQIEAGQSVSVRSWCLVYFLRLMFCRTSFPLCDGVKCS